MTTFTILLPSTLQYTAFHFKFLHVHVYTLYVLYAHHTLECSLTYCDTYLPHIESSLVLTSSMTCLTPGIPPLQWRTEGREEKKQQMNDPVGYKKDNVQIV